MHIVCYCSLNPGIIDIGDNVNLNEIAGGKLPEKDEDEDKSDEIYKTLQFPAFPRFCI